MFSSGLLYYLSAATPVVPIRILQFTLSPNSRGEVSLSLYVPGGDLDSARQRVKGAVLLCAGDRLWFSSMKDFRGSNGDSGVRLSLCDRQNDSGKLDGQLYVRWSCLRRDDDEGGWLRDHELVGDQLQLAVCETLRDVLLRRDESYTMGWGFEYDRNWVFLSRTAVRACQVIVLAL